MNASSRVKPRRSKGVGQGRRPKRFTALRMGTLLIGLLSLFAFAAYPSSTGRYLTEGIPRLLTESAVKRCIDPLCEVGSSNTSTSTANNSNASNSSTTPSSSNITAPDDSLYPPMLIDPRVKGNEAGTFLYVLGILYMFMGLSVVCDEYFVPALEKIQEVNDIGDDVAGATLMAAGGSAPELATSFVGVFFAKSNVGFGTIVGSAVFNVLFVIGMCALFAKELLQLTWWPLFRDSCFYAVSLLLLAVFFGVVSPNEIQVWEALIMFIFYLVYVTFMAHNERIQHWVMSKLSGSASIDPNNNEDGDGQQSEYVPPQNQRRPTMFRAGVLKLMLRGDVDIDNIRVYLVSQTVGDCKETFDKMDQSGDGFVDKKELGAILEELGAHPSEEEVQAYLNEIDGRTQGVRDGMISFEEFKAWYMDSEARIEADCHKAFDKIDLNKDGKLDRGEISAVLELVHGKHATKEDVDKAMAQFDSDKDNLLNFQEFKKWYRNTMLFELHKKRNEGDDDDEEGIDLSFPDDVRGRIVYFLTIPVLYPLYYTIPDVRKPEQEKYYWPAFFLSILWIGIMSYFMVWWADITGQVVGIDPTAMGMTVLAAGTSIPDLLSSVIVARQGKGDMAVSSSIGSNIFDVTVGLPIPWLFYTITNGGYICVISGTLFLSVLVLFLMLVSVIAIIAACGWKMTKGLGLSMFFLYFLYLTQALLREYKQIPSCIFFQCDRAC